MILQCGIVAPIMWTPLMGIRTEGKGYGATMELPKNCYMAKLQHVGIKGKLWTC
jgi:hypothetical protein